MTQNAINRSTVCLQKVTNSDGSLLTATAAIPDDNTIPQSSEGTEVLTLSITPKYSDSTLHLEFTTMFIGAADESWTLALFQDSTADAIAAKCFYAANSGRGIDVYFSHIMTSGTTSSTTFKVRAGSAATNNCYLNGDNAGNALLNGVGNTRLIITEYR